LQQDHVAVILQWAHPKKTMNIIERARKNREEVWVLYHGSIPSKQTLSALDMLTKGNAREWCQMVIQSVARYAWFIVDPNAKAPKYTGLVTTRHLEPYLTHEASKRVMTSSDPYEPCVVVNMWDL
jgi:hypothetical protein